MRTSRLAARLIAPREYGRRLFSGQSRLCKDAGAEFVTLDSANEKERDAIFKYSWGSWARNGAAEKRKRYVPFKISGVNEILKRSRDLSANVSDANVVALVSLVEGKNHRIYRVDLDDGSQYALRIPYPLDYSKAARKARVQSEVATMDFMRKKHNMMIPEIISWSPTADNPLEREYVLMEYIAPDSNGRKMESLMAKWDPVGQNVDQRLAVLQVVVDLLASNLSTKFSAFGSLYFTEDVSPELQNKLPYENETDKDLVDRWRIGPSVENKFWQPGVGEVDSLDRVYTPAEYLSATATAHVTAFTNLLKDRFSVSPAVYSMLPEWRKTYEKYALLAPKLVPDFIPADADILTPRLYHPDVHPMNILVDSTNESADPTAPFSSSYLLDWEGASIKPYMFHGAPRFIEYKGQRIYSLDEIEDYEQLPDDAKTTAMHMVAGTLNEFTFEAFLNRQLPALINAHSPTAKLLREPYTTAMLTDYHYDPREIVRLKDVLLTTQKEWPDLTADGLKSPVDYTPEEAETISKEGHEYGQKIADEFAFYYSEGWAPQDVFENSVKEGLIVKAQNGEYVKKN